jgi:hypothetical protein
VQPGTASVKIQTSTIGRSKMKGFFTVLLGVSVAAALAVSPAAAARRNSAITSDPETTYGVSSVRLPDPQKELRQLSKNLKLKKDQRAGVSFILEERSREIQLLFEIESVSREYRDTLAAKVMEDSNAQIETLLKTKQKRKFDKELAETAKRRRTTT